MHPTLFSFIPPHKHKFLKANCLGYPCTLALLPFHGGNMKSLLFALTLSVFTLPSLSMAEGQACADGKTCAACAEGKACAGKAAQTATAPASTAATPAPGAEPVSMVVKGMHCGGCHVLQSRAAVFSRCVASKQTHMASATPLVTCHTTACTLPRLGLQLQLPLPGGHCPPACTIP